MTFLILILCRLIPIWFSKLWRSLTPRPESSSPISCLQHWKRVSHIIVGRILKLPSVKLHGYTGGSKGTYYFVRRKSLSVSCLQIVNVVNVFNTGYLFHPFRKSSFFVCVLNVLMESFRWHKKLSIDECSFFCCRIHCKIILVAFLQVVQLLPQACCLPLPELSVKQEVLSVSELQTSYKFRKII